MPTEPRNASWIIYPQNEGQRFYGFYTQDEESRAPDLACVYGKNTSPVRGDRITVRNAGIELFQSALSTAQEPVKSLYTFHKRDGSQILMRAYGQYLEWYDEDANSGTGDWVELNNGYTSSDFGFAEFNVNTDQISRIYFGNGYQNTAYWSGSHTLLNGALSGGEATITVDSVLEDTVYRSGTSTGVTTTTLTMANANWGANVWANYYVRITSGVASGQIALISSNTSDTLTFASIGALTGTPTFEIRKVKFDATGYLRIAGTRVAYSGFGSDVTFTGCTGTPAAADNTSVAQAITEISIAPKGNIFMAADNRLFISGDPANPQLVYFSKYSDASSFSTTIVSISTAANAGVFNLAEGGGKVTAMCQDEQAKYFFKENIVYYATLTDSLYTLSALKPFDGKSQTTGAQNKRCVFVGGNKVFFVSKDNQIYSLQRVEYIDYPQMVPISANIQPTVDILDFSEMSGVVFGQYAYFACKQSPDSSFNDLVLVVNHLKETWDSPWVNFNVRDWAVYKTDGKESLFYGDSVTSNVWKFTWTGANDYRYATPAIWTTKAYNFGSPESLKELDGVFVEGYISQGTELTVNLLLDNGGFTQTLETTISGTNTDILFSNSVLNTFGETPFGRVVLGSSADSSGRKPFRVFLNKGIRRTPFFTAQLSFSSDGVNKQWEVLRYGFLVRACSQPIPTKLLSTW